MIRRSKASFYKLVLISAYNRAPNGIDSINKNIFYSLTCGFNYNYKFFIQTMESLKKAKWLQDRLHYPLKAHAGAVWL